MPKLDLRHMLKPASSDSEVKTRPFHPVVPLNRQFHVIPRGIGEFICGFCNKSYSNESYAWMCVAQCSSPLLESIRVSTRADGNMIQYYCPFCFHQYPNREDAAICVDNCRDRVLSLLPSEASRMSLLNSFAEEQQKKVRVRELSKVTRTRSSSIVIIAANTVTEAQLLEAVPMLDEKLVSTDLQFDLGDGSAELLSDAMLSLTDPAIASEVTASETEGSTNDKVVKEEASVAPEAPIEPAVKDEIRIQWKPGLKPFHRLGAQYVCNGCQKKYFSKVEVEACYGSHPVDYSEKKT